MGFARESELGFLRETQLGLARERVLGFVREMGLAVVMESNFHNVDPAIAKNKHTLPDQLLYHNRSSYHSPNGRL